MKFFNGTVYSKALAIFLAAALLLLGAVAALTQLIILRELSLSEQREMKTMLQRFALVMNRESKSLEAIASDWASSPSVVSFLSERSEGILSDRITATSLKELGIDFIILNDQNASVRSFVATDPLLKQELEGGAKIINSVFANRPTPLQGTATYILVNNQLCSIAVYPIYSSTNRKKHIGSLVAGKIYKPGSWSFLEGLFQATIQFNPLKSRQITDQINREFIDLLITQEVIVDAGADKRILGFRLIKNSEGLPLGYASISQTRLLRQEGLRAIQIFLTGISLAGGALVIVFWILLDRTILARIIELTNKLEREKKSDRLPVKLNFQGSDELATLARSIEDLAVRLESTQSRYRDVVEDQTEAISRFDANLNLVFANEVFSRMFRRKTTSENPGHLQDYLPLQTSVDISSRYDELSISKPLATFSHVIDLGTGPLWFRSTLRKNFSDAGVCEGGQWVAADITVQVEAQRQMLESERRFRRLFETASDGILVIEGNDSVVTDINPSLCRMLMLAGSEVLAHPLNEISIFDPCYDIINYYRKNEAFGFRSALFRNDCRLERADGSALFAEVACSSYESGGSNYIQVNFRNITDRISGEKELRRLSSKLLRLQDEERRRIARELHDSTAQNLSALEMNMSLLEPMLGRINEKAERLIVDTRRIAGECSRELRNISYLLHPPLIDEVGLAFAIKWFADGFSKRTGINAAVHIDDTFPRLGLDLEMPLFRVVQEAMTNIYRHSGADRAWVNLHLEGNLFLMEIRDNGKGFSAGILTEGLEEDSTSRPMGVGLAGMRERLANIGGKFFIESTGAGATIRVRLILKSVHTLDHP